MARGRKSKGDSVSGPYKHGTRWRLIVQSGGRQTVSSYPTKEDAEAVRDALSIRLGNASVLDSIDEYITQKAKRGVSADGMRVSRARLVSFFDARNVALAVRDLTPARAASLLAAYAKGTTAETQYKTLAECRLFARWLRERKLLVGDPFAGLKHNGKRSRGKPQLTIDEARKLAAACFARAANEPPAVAVLACLYLGARSGEITSRVGRDIDDDGRILRIPRSKTEAGKRIVEIPAELRPLIAALVTAPGAPLWPGATGKWLHYHCRRLCLMAGVPVVTPHGLRGTHASLSVEAGASSHVVAGSLGHVSFAVTAAHYATKGAVTTALSTRALAKLKAR